MEANRQSENDVVFEDLVGDEQIDSSFDNEEYNSSDGEIGGRIYEEMSDNEEGIDNENRLERLFWCDGESRKNFEVFGDVLAFDATYQKNKYNCPFVVFSGVNHHNQTIVFATGLVTRETEETYVWLLEQFACAMQGKTQISVITDGDIAMKNAIRKVRFCRNASIVHPAITPPPQL
ncbi:hypothetical protein TSUD_211040 [Trifolium subterraneum]|uniref:MULE transposase domain-containing protein n=1 Tax=Trifolium subterraneum TaxID=3900 RepID=A0A2Z6ND31_TRISU|nr:hypothetical protein TSUD_211040 [Trifolium subterraneum]